MAACASQPSSSMKTSVTASPWSRRNPSRIGNAVQAALQASEGNLQVVEAMKLRWKVGAVPSGGVSFIEFSGTAPR
jgi:hypothetical protein